jgi:hypothetical protein
MSTRARNLLGLIRITGTTLPFSNVDSLLMLYRMLVTSVYECVSVSWGLVTPVLLTIQGVPASLHSFSIAYFDFIYSDSLY